MIEPPSFHYERRLQREIEEIESRIKELTQEKNALQRQMMKARRENAGIRDVNRKNSVNRIMIENRVLDALKKSPLPLETAALYKEAKYVDFELNENTFRTQLHRMKNKSLIQNAGTRGRWRLSPSAYR